MEKHNNKQLLSGYRDPHKSDTDCDYCFDEYDMGTCFCHPCPRCGGHVRGDYEVCYSCKQSSNTWYYNGVEFTRCECGKAHPTKYDKCYSCSQNGQTKSGQYRNVKARWSKHKGSWAIQVPHESAVEGDTVTVTTRAGKSEDKKLGRYLAETRWGDLFSAF